MIIKIHHNKKYGLMISGGIDSAVLLSYIADNFPKINLQCFTIPKHDGASLYVDNIITEINARFGTEFHKTIFVGDPNVYHRLQSTIAITEIFQKYEIDFLLNALNTNPAELANLSNAPQRTKKVTHPKMVFPFIHFTKDKILEIMFANKYNFLMGITHSCTEMQLSRCNQCWQCRERAWAFQQVNQLDIGKL